MQPQQWAYFRPYQDATPPRARGCLTCHNFQGEFYDGHLLRQRDGERQVIGVPMMGCAFWMRATGSDDE
jgi:hypothetical protein